MEELVLKSTIKVAQMTELSPSEQALINSAIEATNRSYAVYSNFHVGAAVLLKNGKTVIGCNQENVSFGAGICAERSAIFAAGAQYPDEPVEMIAAAGNPYQPLWHLQTGDDRSRNTLSTSHQATAVWHKTCLCYQRN